MGEQLVARMFDRLTKKWTSTPHGLACECALAFTWPPNATTVREVGPVFCNVRKVGGMNEFGDVGQWLDIGCLVFSCDWILSRHSNGLTIRGCPVSSLSGSPLAVAVRTPTPVAFMAGSALELDLPNPELYKSGKSKLSVLIIGFYCSKKHYIDDGAVFHVSSPVYRKIFCLVCRPSSLLAGKNGRHSRQTTGWRTQTQWQCQSWRGSWERIWYSKPTKT